MKENWKVDGFLLRFHFSEIFILLCRKDQKRNYCEFCVNAKYRYVFKPWYKF